MSEDFDPIKSELEPKEPDTETELELDDSLKDYVLEKGREEYLEPETSGMDRLQDKIASTIEKYNSEFGKGVVQGAAGSVSAAGAVYDGIQELREDEYNHSISLYDQMERNRVEDKSLPRKVGEAAGFTAAATAGVHNPEIFLSGAAQNARHIGERQIHEKARDKFYKPEQTAS